MNHNFKVDNEAIEMRLNPRERAQSKILNGDGSTDSVLVYKNIFHNDIPKHRTNTEIMQKYFFIPYKEDAAEDEYASIIDELRKKYFYKTVASINSLSVVSIDEADASPHLSQLCSGAIITDTKGKFIFMVNEADDDTPEFRIPQSHILYTPRIYTESLDEYIYKNAIENINDELLFERKDGEPSQIRMVSGFVSNSNKDLSKAMHTMFGIIFQVDDFDNYNILCFEENQRAIIMNFEEAVSASEYKRMDTWMSEIFTKH